MSTTDFIHPPIHIPGPPNNPSNANSTDPAVPGVQGTNESSDFAMSRESGVGVYGQGAFGVQGEGETGNGVIGRSINADGVLGKTTSSNNAGVSGLNSSRNPGPNAAGIFGECLNKGGFAGKFIGDVQVTGSLNCDGDHHCGGTMHAKRSEEHTSELQSPMYLV